METQRSWMAYGLAVIAVNAFTAAATGAGAPLQAQAGGDDDPLPLEGARSLAYTAEEGTWISLDVSPDGRTLVFDLLGDLYTLPIEGGTATRLTEGMAFDAQPRFSPDGSRVVFTSDRDGAQNIWIMALDGSDTVQVSEGRANRAESPEWTPDGDYIVASMGDFRGSTLPKLHLYHVDGGGGTKLIDEPERLKTLGAAFGPDPRYVWFSRKNGDWDYNAQLPQHQLAVYDRDTGEVYSRSSRVGSGMRPTLSPDGRYLVYGTRHDAETGLVLRDLASGDERWLAYPVQHDDQESRGTLDLLPGMSFTPDSEHLIASYGGRIWSIPIDGGAASEIPFRASVEVKIGPLVDFDYPISDEPTFTARQIRDAVPSPDGRRLAFVALDQLHVSNIDGSNPRRLTSGDASEHHPAWSPDGEWIAYAAWEGDAGHLYKVPASGGQPTRLTTAGAVYLTPAWSSSGERIVTARGFARAFRESSSPRAAQGAATELVWVPATGGEATVIMPTRGDAFPHFRADDPDRIYLFGGASDGLVSVRWDGSDQKAHVNVRGLTPRGASQPRNPNLILMAPRGDQALAQIDHHVYAFTVPRVGGEAPTISLGDPENAQFPARKLTEVGGEFPNWSADGRTVHFSLGNAFFTYDLDRAAAVEDSLAALGDEEADEEADPDEEGEGGEEEDDEGYRPTEVRIEVTFPRDVPNGVALLRGARVITMVGDEVIEDGDVLVRSNRIEAVGASGTLEVPGDAEVVDVSGATIVPGFVDIHAHMRPSWGVHRRDQWVYLANLAYGVTTTRDPQTATTDVLTYADMVRAGHILGPRVYSTGPGVFWQERVRSLDHARDILRRYSDYFDTKTLKMYVAGNRQQRQWLIMAAREEGIMPTTEGSLNIKQNITETIDGYPGLEHSLPVYPVYEDLVRLFVAAERVYTPTLLVAYGGPWAENFFYQTENVHGDAKLRRFMPHPDLDRVTRRRPQWFMEEEHVFEDHARFVADLVEAGGRAGVGSHGQLQGLGYHWELWAMQAGGLSEHDALRTATIFGAEAIGLDEDLGTLEAGKLADLVVLRGNPLDDIRNTADARYVMVNGRLFEGDSLDQIFPERRSLEPLWWWERDPAELPGVGGD